MTRRHLAALTAANAELGVAMIGSAWLVGRPGVLRW